MDNEGVPNAVPFVGQTLIENNIVFNNGGRGIAVFQSSNLIVRNNTLYNNLLDPQFNPLKQAAELSLNTGANNHFYNNIAYITGNILVHYAFLDVRSTGGDIFDYNVAYGGNTKSLFTYLSTGLTLGAHNLLSDNPMFAPGKFFQLQAVSPALGAGTTDNPPSIDYLGNPRYATGPIDVGAYQRPL
jgi:parallel beta-helix repeat protein